MPFTIHAGYPVAGRGAPTFLKRQKEQKRAARALAKREARQARRENRASAAKTDEFSGEDLLSEPTAQDPEADPEANPEADEKPLG